MRRSISKFGPSLSCALLLTLALASCARSDATGESATPASSADNALLATANNGDDWPGYGRTYRRAAFQPAERRSTTAMSARSASPGRWICGPAIPRRTRSRSAASLYMSSGLSIVHAVDAATGKLLWTYDSKVARTCRQGDARLLGHPRHRLVERQGLHRHGRRPADRDRRQDRQGSLDRSRPRSRATASSSPARRASSTARSSSARAAATPPPTAATPPPTTPRPASSSGASTSCPATRRTASRTRPWRWPPRPGPANGGSSAAAASRGTPSPTTPRPTRS